MWSRTYFSFLFFFWLVTWHINQTKPSIGLLDDFFGCVSTCLWTILLAHSSCCFAAYCRALLVQRWSVPDLCVSCYQWSTFMLGWGLPSIPWLACWAEVMGWATCKTKWDENWHMESMQTYIVGAGGCAAAGHLMLPVTLMWTTAVCIFWLPCRA